MPARYRNRPHFSPLTSDYTAITPKTMSGIARKAARIAPNHPPSRRHLAGAAAATQADAVRSRHLLWTDGLAELALVSAAGWENGIVAPDGTTLVSGIGSAADLVLKARHQPRAVLLKT